MIRDLHGECRQRLQVSPGQEGKRLDRFLLGSAPGISRAALVALVASGAVRVNGRRARKGQRLCSGDRVEVAGMLSSSAQADSRVPLTVRFEDSSLLVVDKPAGLPCHPLRPAETRTLASALLARYPELRQVGFDPREPGLIHRLDTDTSGLLLVARDPLTFGELRRALKQGRVRKTYLARCVPASGSPPLARGFYEALLCADRGPRVVLTPVRRGRVREILSEVCGYELLPDGTALVQVRVHCAARHQVRAHLADLGYPLLGDVMYGGPPRPGGHLLHASSLTLHHPKTGALVAVESPLPAAMTAAWDRA